MPNYEKSIIYKIFCKDENIKDIYVGATCDFIKRKSLHKRSCINKNDLEEFNTPLYYFMRLHGGWDNWIIEKVEQVSCRDKRHRNRVEAQYIKNLGATLNRDIPQDIDEGLNYTEWKAMYYQTNREKIREKVREKGKEYRENNREKIREKGKEYRENNREKLREKGKEYRENNREKIREKITCKCGSIVSKNHKARHEKSKKHQKYIQSLINQI